MGPTELGTCLLAFQDPKSLDGRVICETTRQSMCETTSQLDSLYGRIINKPKLKPPGVQDQTPSQIP